MLTLKKVLLNAWQENEDLRYIQSRAREILGDAAPGEGALVTNARFGTRQEKFRIVVRDHQGYVWVLTPPRQDSLAGLFVKVHAFLAEAFS